MEKTHQSSDKAKDSCNYKNFSFERNRPYGLSWPPRCYTCSFCNKEFKSAQGLGGHMNVHRRDRARLRESPLWVSECSNPNDNTIPNPNPSFSSPSPSSSSHSSTKPLCLLSPSLIGFSSPSLLASTDDKMPIIAGLSHDLLGPQNKDIAKKKGIVEVKGPAQEDEFEVIKEGKIARLGMEVGLLRGAKEDLDLELRLGYP